MGWWLGAAWRDTVHPFGPMIPFGMVASAVLVLQIIASSILQATLSGSATWVGVLASQLVSSALYTFLDVGLTGVFLARCRGRIPAWGDFFPSRRLLLHAWFAGFLAVNASNLLVGVAASPMILSFMGDTQQATALGTIVGVAYVSLFVLPLALALAALRVFISPLVLDRRLDFWSAMLVSADCARRDLVGLTCFCLIGGFLWVLGIVPGCCAGMVLSGPFYGALKVRAYQGYFGIEETEDQRPKSKNPMG